MTDETKTALLSKLRAPVADERKETAGVTLDGCLETLFRVGEHLGIDYAESRKQPGAPSGIYIKAIEDRVSQAINAAREEAAKLMEQTSRSSGATLIRSLASASVAGEAQKPVAWRHTLHYETSDTSEIISDSEESPFGTPGVDYSDTYRVTSEPLYAAPQASTVAGEAQQCVACEGRPSGDNIPCALCGMDAAPQANPVTGEAQPVAWRYQTPTGWHATTDAQKAVSLRAHHPVEPLYPKPQARECECSRKSKAVSDSEAQL